MDGGHLRRVVEQVLVKVRPVEFMKKARQARLSAQDEKVYLENVKPNADSRKTQEALQLASKDINISFELMRRKLRELHRLLQESQEYSSCFETRSLWLSAEIGSEEVQEMARNLNGRLDLILEAWLLVNAKEVLRSTSKGDGSSLACFSVAEGVRQKLDDLEIVLESLSLQIGIHFRKCMYKQLIRLPGLKLRERLPDSEIEDRDGQRLLNAETNENHEQEHAIDEALIEEGKEHFDRSQYNPLATDEVTYTVGNVEGNVLGEVAVDSRGISNREILQVISDEEVEHVTPEQELLSLRVESESQTVAKTEFEECTQEDTVEIITSSERQTAKVVACEDDGSASKIKAGEKDVLQDDQSLDSTGVGASFGSFSEDEVQVSLGDERSRDEHEDEEDDLLSGIEDNDDSSIDATSRFKDAELVLMQLQTMLSAVLLADAQGCSLDSLDIQMQNT